MATITAQSTAANALVTYTAVSAGGDTYALGTSQRGTLIFRNTNTPLTSPTGFTATAVGTGGTFAAATYYWKITATNALGETLASIEASAAIALNGSANLAWTAVTGATGYRIYRATTTGGQNVSPAFVAAVGAVTAYTDTGTAATTGAVPTANTTATVTVTLTAATACNQGFSHNVVIVCAAGDTEVAAPANCISAAGNVAVTYSTATGVSGAALVN